MLTLRTALPWPRYDSTARAHSSMIASLPKSVRCRVSSRAAYITGLPSRCVVASGGGDRGSGSRTRRAKRGDVALRHADSSSRRCISRSAKDVMSAKPMAGPALRCRRQRVVRQAVLAERERAREAFQTSVRRPDDRRRCRRRRVRGTRDHERATVYSRTNSSGTRRISSAHGPRRSLEWPVTTLLRPFADRAGSGSAAAISNVRTMDDVVAEETASRVAQLRVLMVLASIAL